MAILRCAWTIKCPMLSQAYQAHCGQPGACTGCIQLQNGGTYCSPTCGSGCQGPNASRPFAQPGHPTALAFALALTLGRAIWAAWMPWAVPWHWASASQGPERSPQLDASWQGGPAETKDRVHVEAQAKVGLKQLHPEGCCHWARISFPPPRLQETESH